jgi:pantoate--beta-alanine ligase
MSSRNQYLSEAQRQQAGLLIRLLRGVREAIRAGQADYSGLSEAALAELTAAGFAPDYFEVRRATDLQPPQAADTDLVALVAARLGNARLIDNLRIQRVG